MLLQPPQLKKLSSLSSKFLTSTLNKSLEALPDLLFL
jgi:hypothetical protein